MKEVDDLLQGFLGLVLTGHILEGDTRLLLHIHLGVGLAHIADAADTAAASGQKTHHQHEGAQHEDGGQDIGDHKLQDGTHLLLHGRSISHMMLIQQRIETAAVDVGGVENDLGFFGVGIGLRLLAALIGVNIAVNGDGIDLAVLKFHPGDLVLTHQIRQSAEIHLKAGGIVGGIAGIGGKIVETDGQHQGPGQQHQHPPEVAPALAVFVVIVFRIHRGLLPLKISVQRSIAFIGSIPYK